MFDRTHLVPKRLRVYLVPGIKYMRMSLTRPHLRSCSSSFVAHTLHALATHMWQSLMNCSCANCQESAAVSHSANMRTRTRTWISEYLDIWISEYLDIWILLKTICGCIPTLRFCVVQPCRVLLQTEHITGVLQSKTVFLQFYLNMFDRDKTTWTRIEK